MSSGALMDFLGVLIGFTQGVCSVHAGLVYGLRRWPNM